MIRSFQTNLHTYIGSVWTIYLRSVLTSILLQSNSISPFLFSTLFHKHPRCFSFHRLISRIAIFHLLQKSFSLQKNIASKISCIFFSTHYVSRFLLHFELHNLYLFNLFDLLITCFPSSFQKTLFSSCSLSARRFACARTLSIFSFFNLSI